MRIHNNLFFFYILTIKNIPYFSIILGILMHACKEYDVFRY